MTSDEGISSTRRISSLSHAPASQSPGIGGCAGLVPRDVYKRQVSDDEDREENGVDLVNTLAVGGKQGTDQQHCCAGCPNEGCQDAANCQEDCVVSWGCSNIAGEVNTTRDHVEREQ